jgi:hypothetical protein
MVFTGKMTSIAQVLHFLNQSVILTENKAYA